MDHGSEEEQYGEYYSCGHGRAIAIVPEPLCVGFVRHGAVWHGDRTGSERVLSDRWNEQTERVWSEICLLKI